MGQPLPPEILLPRNAQGVRRRAYLNPYSGTYTTSRSYALRMQRGYARGLPQYEARGKPAGEALRRRQAAAAAGEPTPWEAFLGGFRQRYGFSYSYWRKLKRNYVDEINRRSSPDAQITPYTIATAKQAWEAGLRNERTEYPSWEPFVEDELDARLYDQIEFQDNDNPDPGRDRFNQRSSLMPVELYWYH